LAAHCIHDEVDVLSWDKLNNLLDNMVAILIFDYSQDLRLKLSGQLGLLLD
jgi:hypothetical protein